MASLNIVRGPTAGNRIDLDKEHTVIGRTPDCEVAVPSNAIGRRHARITRQGGRFVLEDLDSRGGTYLNMRQIRGLSPLCDGDRIRICDFEVIFESPTEIMTESDWVATQNSQALLSCLRANGGTSGKRLRLFVTACRQRFGLLGQHQYLAVVLDPWQDATDSVRQAIEDASSTLAWSEPRVEGIPPRRRPEAERWVAYHDAEDVLCHLLRDMVPNPFRPPFAAPAVLAWQDGMVVRLAQAAYEERHLPSGELDLVRLAILADALEEAGADVGMIAHLRGPGPHWRGCWVVDLVLGKS